MDDESIIIAATLIALEEKPVLSLKDLSSHAYKISKNIGMKKFSPSNFENIFIPLTIPTLAKSNLINTVNGGSHPPQNGPDEVNLNTVCKLTENTAKNMKKLRRGFRVKLNDIDQKEIFNNLDTIINGHIDKISD